MIPQTDPKAGYRTHQQAIDSAIRQVLDSGWYIHGQRLQAFEEAFAAWIGCSAGIGVANGTDAIELALRACGVGAGHLVFTVSHTAVATVVGVERSGATPLLVDIDPTTYTMSAESLEQAIRAAQSSPTTFGLPKAIVAVHLYGHPVDLPAIADIARRYDLILIEDCAQAHGAIFQGQKIGSFGQAAAFSFYPTKNLGALGDGGIITTCDPSVADRCRMLREYGWRQRYISEIPGVNSRLDELQAAILHAKLAFLDADNARRQQIARAYNGLLADSRLSLPVTRPQCTHVYHQYVLRTPDRDDLRQHLKDQQVGALVHYPVPVHLQPAYRRRLPLPVPLAQTELAAQQVLSIPMFPELVEEQIATVAARVLSWPGLPKARV